MKCCIVVARYNENVEWSQSFQNVIIYNKGISLGTTNEILLKNVGREGHTYYKYICDNYDNLSDYTVFLQANPFDHSPNIISNLNKCVHCTNLCIDFMFLSEKILDCNLSGCRHHHGLPLVDIYYQLFGQRKTYLNFKFGAGAQFIVSKNCILNRPKAFYSKIVKILEKNINPIEGFVIERFHRLIFNVKTPDKHVIFIILLFIILSNACCPKGPQWSKHAFVSLTINMICYRNIPNLE